MMRHWHERLILLVNIRYTTFAFNHLPLRISLFGTNLWEGKIWRMQCSVCICRKAREESIALSQITLERRQECIHDEKRERGKRCRGGRLNMVIWKLRPFYWRSVEGLRFTILSHTPLAGNVVEPSPRINAVRRDSLLLFVCVECTSEPLRGVKRNKELQQGQS